MNITLTKEQARKVTFDYIADTLITMKQYLSPEDANHYKFMLREMGPLLDLEVVAIQYDKAWPREITWWNEE